MAVNKVVINDETKLDLSQDSVTSSSLLENVTAHDKDGNAITGGIKSYTNQTLSPSVTFNSYSTSGSTAQIQFNAVNVPTGYFNGSKYTPVYKVPLVNGGTYIPTTTRQTIASSGTNYFKTSAIVEGDTNLVGDNIKKGVSIFGVDGTYEGSGGGGGLPTGFSAIATGTYNLSSAIQGGVSFTMAHNLGVVPDIFMFYSPTNVATTYSMLGVFYSAQFGWRSSTYLNKCFYHGNSTTTATGADVTTTYGVKSLTATTATITTYSNSTSYYWRAGTYKWVAIKF